MIGLKIALTGLLFAVVSTLAANICDDDTSNSVKVIIVITFIMGLVAAIAGIIYAIWS